MFYDKKFQIIKKGDILKFDNGEYFVVIEHSGQLVIQNMSNLSMPLVLRCIAISNCLSSAIKILNIYTNI